MAGVLVDTLRVGIARLRSVRNQRRQACDLGARASAFAIYLRAHVQVAGQVQVVIHDGVQRAFRQPAIAHFRIHIQAAHGDPVGAAFIAQQIAPAAGACAIAEALAIAHRAGAGDQVDAICAGQ